MRDAPPSLITGPTLIFKSGGKGAGSFFCSRCRTDFHTEDPALAFQLFSGRKHKCASQSKPVKPVMASGF